MTVDDEADGARVLIMGSGAIGAFYGGRLAQSGADVVFVARGANLAALRREGLRIDTAAGSERLAPVQAVETPAEAGPCDVVLVCVKSYDTAAAAQALRPAVRGDTIVLSLQNGVENEATLAAILDLPPLLGGLTQIGAALTAPGVVHYESGGRLIFGEMDGRPTARVERLARLFARAGLDHRASRSIAVMLWDKLAWNAAFNALTAVTQRTVGELLARPDGRELARAAMLEVVAVARANGVALENRVEESLRYSEAELGHLRTSMLQDRERGRRLEYDALNGAVVRAAERAGIDAPVHRVLYGLLAAIDSRLA